MKSDYPIALCVRACVCRAVLCARLQRPVVLGCFPAWIAEPLFAKREREESFFFARGARGCDNGRYAPRARTVEDRDGSDVYCFYLGY